MRTPLYIVTPGASISYSNGRLRISFADSSIEESDLAVRSISSIVIYGPASFSPHTLELLLRLNITCNIFSVNGRFIGKISPSESSLPKLTTKILSLHNNPISATKIAKMFVLKKLYAMLHLTEVVFKNADPQHLEGLKNQINLSHSTINDLKQRDFNIEEMRGIEGRMTKLHYQVINLAIKKSQEFFSLNSRIRRPPVGGTNALLSFGYSLLLCEALVALEDRGLPASIGFLHSAKVKYKPALALDFMEPFRSLLVERLVLRLINLGQISPDNFETKNEGTYLNNDGRKIFTREWMKHLNQKRSTLKGSLRDQVWQEAVKLRNIIENTI